MRLHTRRILRWGSRTAWMARAVAADFGFATEKRGRRDTPPLWLRDNPFLHRAMRGETRRASIYWRTVIFVLLMGGLFLACLYAIAQFSRPIESFARSTIGVPAAGLIAMILPFFQILALISVRSSVTPSLIAEARRQTLDALIGSPMRPAEILLAMTAGPTGVALLVSLTALPIYILLAQMGGMELGDIVALYLLLAALAFAPPTYTLPPLAGGPSPQQATAIAKAQQSRPEKSAAFSGSSLSFFWLFYMAIFWSHLPGGSVLFHLIAPLSMPHGPLRILMVFAWPLTLAKLLLAPLPFYQISLPPLLYLLPLTFAGKIAAMLKTAASLTASEPAEIARAPLFRRHAAIALWRRRFLLLCITGYAWRLCILRGDTAAILGRAPGGGWDEAGLLTLFCGAAVLGVCGRITMMRALSPQTLRLDPPRILVRRVLRKAMRPMRAALLLFGAACLFAGDSPFRIAPMKTLGNIALVTLALVVFGVGLKSMLTAWVIRRKVPALLQWLLLLATPLIPLGAIWLPGSAVHLAALNPVGLWLDLFPCAQSWLQATAVGVLRAQGWPFGDQISFLESVSVIMAAGVLFLRMAYRMQRVSAARSGTTAETGSSELEVVASQPAAIRAPAAHAGRTEALMAWVSQHVDNPLFIRELRTQTRSGAWFQWLRWAPAIFLLFQLAAIFYPDTVGITASGLGWLHFFDASSYSATFAAPLALVALAGGFMTAQIYTTVLRLAPVVETMLLRDQQRGILGAILLTPLKTRQIFWGMLLGQSALAGVQWAIWSGLLLLLNLEAAWTVGLGPALAAWIAGQIFAAILLIFSAAMGGAMTTHLVKRPNWKGISILTSLAPIGGIVYLEYVVFAGQFEAIDPLWRRVSAHLLIGAAAAIPLTALGVAYGIWRLQRLRDRDIAFGDSIPR